jgi:hypothetical protein
VRADLQINQKEETSIITLSHEINMEIRFGKRRNVYILSQNSFYLCTFRAVRVYTYMRAHILRRFNVKRNQYRDISK